jgi:ATP-binding cassette subfamily F protein 3
MILVALHSITKGFPTGDVLKGVDWEIKSGEKIAFLGRNGSGKSTLLGIISGRVTAESGSRTLGRGVQIVEMGQIPERAEDISLFDYLIAAREDLQMLRQRVAELSDAVAESPHDAELQTRLGTAQSDLENAGGYQLEQQVQTVLTGLGFTRFQWEQPLVLFSGGERTRIELGRLLLTPSDLWLLDEPTNHLDIPAVEWLEEFLAKSPVACVLVSHDRVLLERFGGRVVELIDGKLEQYDGDYRYYRTEQPVRLARRQKAYEMQQAEIKRIEDFIARNIAGQKTRQAQSKRLALSKVERLKAPKRDGRALKLAFQTQRSSFREVLVINDFSKRFGERVVLNPVSFECERGDKVGVIGPNGTGKTSLLRAIVGLDDFYSGEIRIGERVELGYFDQHLEILNGTGSVIEEIWDEHEYFTAGELRSYLARFLFTGDDVFKPVSAISGGERSRLALAKLMLTKANFLVLDEPTNHLDINSREVLEEALAEFEGTALVVSHDRRFLDRFTNKILYVADGTAVLSLGHYSDWAARHTSLTEARTAQSTATSASTSESAASWQARKARRAQEQKLQRRRQKLQEEIATLERQVQSIETELSDDTVAHDWKRLADLTAERGKLYDRLNALYEELEGLPERAESD